MMPNLLLFDPAQIVGFFIIFTRLSGLMIMAPILGDNNVPVQIKVAFTFLLSVIFFPVVSYPNFGANPDIGLVGYVSLTEFGIGLLLGFAVRLLFAGVSLAGEVAGFQMGVSIANIFDPTSAQQVSLIGQIQVIFALLLFVVLDGHHVLIKSIVESYRIVPAGGVVIGESSMRFIVGQVGNIFLVGLKIGAPLIVALLAANFSMGLIARSVPQMNVVVVGFPFTIGLGLFFLFVGFPLFIRTMEIMIGRLDSLLMLTMKLLT